jgi:hypothetical protein
MTDQEELAALLTKWGVPFTDSSGEVCVGYSSSPASGSYESPKIDGYSSFYTAFEFTDEGQFIKMGAWE